MQNLILYPSKSALQKGVALGVAYLVGAAAMARTEAFDDAAFAPVILAGFGLLFLVKSGLAIARPKPCFEADASGFSVMGKEKLPWSKFGGTRVRVIRIYAFPVAKWVQVKTGTGLFAGSQEIKWTHLSDKAEVMAGRIDQFAARVAAGAVAATPERLEGFEAATRAPEPATPTRQSGLRTAPVAMSAKAATDGPVQSVPTMSERIFGRKKQAY